LFIKDHVCKITTDKNSFVVKQLKSDRIQSAIQGERIASAFIKNNIPAITTINSVVDWENKKFLIYPWCEGKLRQSDKNCGYQIGKLLARMHLINLELPEITNANWQAFIEPNWEQLTKQKNLKLLLEYLPELKQWSEWYRQGIAEIQDDKVISHGDLYPVNVIWQNEKPAIIDWEDAGWIHPQVELLGVAINWAGIEQGKIDPEIFNRVLQGYRDQGGVVAINEAVWNAGLGSWLSWLVFNAERNNSKEVRKTIIAMQHLFSAFVVLKNIQSIVL